MFDDGEAVRTGVVEFQSRDHRLNARGKIERDGTFVLGTHGADDGAVEGRHQAIVVQFLTNEGQGHVVHDHGGIVHRKYASYDTAELDFVVEPKSNELTVTVTR